MMQVLSMMCNPTGWNIDILTFDFIDEDGAEGYTYHNGDKDIVVELYANSTKLTLAHELVHVAQIIRGEPFCEEEAYLLETYVMELL